MLGRTDHGVKAVDTATHRVLPEHGSRCSVAHWRSALERDAANRSDWLREGPPSMD